MLSDPVLELLTVHGLSYFTAVDPQLAKRVEIERRSLAQRFTSEQWDKRIESNSRHIQIVLFNGIIRDAKQWLFGQNGAEADAVAASAEPDPEALDVESPDDGVPDGPVAPDDPLSPDDPSDDKKTLN